MSLNLLKVTAIYDQLTQFANLDSFWTQFSIAFGTNYDVSLATTFRTQWQARDFSALPKIRVLDSGMNGALGAYASSTDTIYLSQSFLETASSPEIFAVILEEIGHSVDNKININDSLGDEGEIFSALVRGVVISEENLQALQAQNDFSSILVNGQPLSVETAAPTVTLSVFRDSVTEDGRDILTYTFRRSNTSTDLYVYFRIAGTAILNTDYTVGGDRSFTNTRSTDPQNFSVDFYSGGPTTVEITIDPRGDLAIEGNETISLTLENFGLGSNIGYDIGTTAPVTATIIDDDDAGFTIAQTPGNSSGAANALLLSDSFTALSDPTTTNLNDNLEIRQTNSLVGPTNWVKNGNAQVGNPTAGIDGGNYLLVDASGTAALDRNFNGAIAQGGLKISFDLAINITGQSWANWSSFNLGLSEANKNASTGTILPHFGIRFRRDGLIEAFDGSINNNVTGGYSSWGGGGNDGTLNPFSIFLTDPTDNNPFNGVGQTNIDIYRGNTLIYSYIKGNGGYRDNYLNFGTSSVGGVDNLKIEKLEPTLRLVEGGATDSYSIVLNRPPTADVTFTFNGGAQLNMSPKPRPHRDLEFFDGSLSCCNSYLVKLLGV